MPHKYNYIQWNTIKVPQQTMKNMSLSCQFGVVSVPIGRDGKHPGENHVTTCDWRR